VEALQFMIFFKRESGDMQSFINKLKDIGYEN